MTGPSIEIFQACTLAMVLVAIGARGKNLEAGQPRDAAADGPVLVGEMTRAEIESALPEWMEDELLADPDVESANALLTALPGAEVTVLLGTWCADSRRELTRLWRALDQAGAADPRQLRYIGVDRAMLEPREWVAGSALRFVPTFIVRRQGQELGRIVESSPEGIEVDLLKLLLGEKSGVVTDSDELEQVEDEDGE
jgi:thioredoxin 1